VDEQYDLPRIAASVPLNVLPQWAHFRSTRSFLRDLLLWPETNRLFSATAIPQPHSQYPKTIRPEWLCALSFQV
jgi:hypothetical protein